MPRPNFQLNFAQHSRKRWHYHLRRKEGIRLIYRYWTCQSSAHFIIVNARSKNLISVAHVKPCLTLRAHFIYHILYYSSANTTHVLVSLLLEHWFIATLWQLAHKSIVLHRFYKTVTWKNGSKGIALHDASTRELWKFIKNDILWTDGTAIVL